MNAFHASLLNAPLLFSQSWSQQALPFFHQLTKQAEAKPLTTAPVAPRVQLVANVPGSGPQLGRMADYMLGQSAASLTAGSVAVINLTGPLIRYSWWMPSTEDYRLVIETFLAMPEIVGIVLVTDSPGGQASGIADLYDTIAGAEKPIIALVAGVAASAAYYAIAGAAEIWSSQASNQIGSIGAYITLLDASKAYEQEGYKLIEIYARVSGEKNGPYRAALAGDESPMQDMLDELVGFFHAAVRTGRGKALSDASATTVFAGADYFAQKAKELGLIDQIGTLKSAVARVYELADGGWKNPRAAQESSTTFLPTLDSQNDMALFDKHPLITALRGVAADQITEEQAEAINADLTAQGIGLTVLRTSDITRLEALENTNATLTSTNATLTAEVARLGTQPGATPSAPVKLTETTPVAAIESADATPFYSQADAELKKMKAVLN